MIYLPNQLGIPPCDPICGQIFGRKGLWSLPRQKDEEIYLGKEEVCVRGGSRIAAQVEEIDLTTEHAGVDPGRVFCATLLLIRVIWGIWHWPIIFMGYEYALSIRAILGRPAAVPVGHVGWASSWHG